LTAATAIETNLLGEASRVQVRLKVPLNRQGEDRPDQLIVTLEKGDRSRVAEAGEDPAEFEMLAVEHIVDDEAYGRPEYILVLDIEALDPGKVQALVDLGQEVIADEVPVLDVSAPRERRMGNVVAQLEAGEMILDSADRPGAAGERIANFGPFGAEADVELGAGPADRVEQERARALESEPIGVRKIADTLPVLADANEVDDVG